MRIATTLMAVFAVSLVGTATLSAQATLSGKVRDAETGETLIGAVVQLKHTARGVVTDWDGAYMLKVRQEFPLQLSISYLGYKALDTTIQSPGHHNFELEPDQTVIETVEVRASRISDKQREEPLTVESLDAIAIKQSPGVSFYEGLGNLKGVDLTTASMGFTIVNTRGFNSTSPVRSLQLIDGVDNQSPGLNFSLGNFLGAPELDVLKVDIIAGASTAFYGPNAFNGVISMFTKDPFIHQGLSAQLKAGERSLTEFSLRWAQTLSLLKSDDLAYKINFQYLSANDWEATNYDPAYQSRADADNPGGYDAVNIYGDENIGSEREFLGLAERIEFPGLGRFYRRGYRETDLVDYDTRNIKANAGLYYKIDPSTVLSATLSHGNGNTVYQADNRYRLDDIRFYQAKLEIKRDDRYFIRSYYTTEDAGQSYDAYFTALRLMDFTKNSRDFTTDYVTYWQIFVKPKILALEGYPSGFPWTEEDFAQQEMILGANMDSLFAWHADAQAAANKPGLRPVEPFLEPGSDRFNEAFEQVTSNLPTDDDLTGTRFYDRSDLFHLQGEYTFRPEFGEIRTGANYRKYTPDTRGTIFLDTMGRELSTWEAGLYAGIEKKFLENKLKVNATGRLDQHENFDLVFSPALSLVYSNRLDHVFRLSFSSAIRNPTLADQYLYYNVGRALLIGNLNGINNLVTINSLRRFSSSRNTDDLNYFNIDPIRPERVKTVEAGYRATLFDRVWLDANYYYSWYEDFIGYNLGADVDYDQLTKFITFLQIYRVSANADSRVTTQGASVGFNAYLNKFLLLSGNYSWNVLNKKGSDDPIVPAYNTPEHKFNIGLSARDLELDLGFSRLKNFGFNVNYKWIEGHLYEGSPQFTGFIPTYDLLDAQINWNIKPINTTVKIGATNLLNKKQFQTYGGPRVGRLAYISFLYEYKK